MQLLGAMKSYYFYYNKIITLSYVQHSSKEANADLLLCIKEVYGQYVGF